MDISTEQIEENKTFLRIADIFITQANQECKATNDHQLVNASLLYASARFNAFITASMAESKKHFQESVDSATEFYTEEFNKMLKEHMKQYSSIFDKK